jgi:hypothetical protein
MARYTTSRYLVVPPRNTGPNKVVLYKLLLRGPKRGIERALTSSTDIDENDKPLHSDSDSSDTVDEEIEPDGYETIDLEHLLKKMNPEDFICPKDVDHHVKVLISEPFMHLSLTRMGLTHCIEILRDVISRR